MQWFPLLQNRISVYICKQWVEPSQHKHWFGKNGLLYSLIYKALVFDYSRMYTLPRYSGCYILESAQFKAFYVLKLIGFIVFDLLIYKRATCKLHKFVECIRRNSRNWEVQYTANCIQQVEECIYTILSTLLRCDDARGYMLFTESTHDASLCIWNYCGVYIICYLFFGYGLGDDGIEIMSRYFHFDTRKHLLETASLKTIRIHSYEWTKNLNVHVESLSRILRTTAAVSSIMN